MDYILTRNIRRPGKPGTKKYVRIYEDDLVCVRYKYDYKHKKRYKTIELLVEENDWVPPKGDRHSVRRVYVRISVAELSLRNNIKAAGGIWIAPKKVWKVPIQAVWDLDIEDRIVPAGELDQ